jgi:hypothetical protein
MTVKQLHIRWLWTTVLAFAAFAVLVFLDGRLKSVTGFGTVDLQKVATAQDFANILAHWYAPTVAVLAGFNLGFDFLFMPLYALSFFYSGLIVRERYTPNPGFPRRAMQFVAAIPLAGAVADAIENGLETQVLVSGSTNDSLANLAFTATNAKMLCFYIGLALLAGAIVARLAPRRSEDDFA